MEENAWKMMEHLVKTMENGRNMNDKWENSSKVEKTTHQTLKNNNMTETLRTLKNEQNLINIE